MHEAQLIVNAVIVQTTSVSMWTPQTIVYELTI